MTVVRKRVRVGENSPASVLRERMAASAYLWHGYGARSSARARTSRTCPSTAAGFYRYYYQPTRRASDLGRIDEAAALKLAQKSFGPIKKPSRKLIGTYTVEPTQDGERSVSLRRAGDVQIVSALYHIPSGADPEYPAIDVLVALLNHVRGAACTKRSSRPASRARFSAPSASSAKPASPTSARASGRTLADGGASASQQASWSRAEVGEAAFALLALGAENRAREAGLDERFVQAPPREWLSSATSTSIAGYSGPLPTGCGRGPNDLDVAGAAQADAALAVLRRSTV